MADVQPEPNRQNEEEVSRAETDRVNGANIPLFYSNTTRVNTGFFDVRCIFAEMIPSGPIDAPGQAKIVVVPHVAVVMSPEHAKALVKTLTRSLERYEAQYGKIRERPQEPESEGSE